jgi:hypothetical protein
MNARMRRMQHGVTIFISAVTGIKIAGMITIPVILRMEENQ